MANPSAQSSLRLRITLEKVSPQVWRTLLVPGSVKLAKLHDFFQVAMGWGNCHLHSFTVGDRLYGVQDDDSDEDAIDEEEVSVFQALDGEARFVYEYDFGDSWTHHVVVEDVAWSALGLKHAVCLGGENACPPEDCGGSWGYQHLLEVVADPSHEEHAELLGWLGPFDPAHFDLAGTNAALQRLR